MGSTRKSPADSDGDGAAGRPTPGVTASFSRSRDDAQAMVFAGDVPEGLKGKRVLALEYAKLTKLPGSGPGAARRETPRRRKR